MIDNIRLQIEESLRVKQLIMEDKALLESVAKATEICIKALEEGKKLMFAGNGGSAADAQHLSAELVNRFAFDRPAIAALSLSTDTSVITSVSNDYSFDILFARQVESIGIKGDVFIALSTSGNSINILNGLKAASEKGINTIGLTGTKGGKMGEYCDLLLKIPSVETPRIQEATILIGHIICTGIENHLFGNR
jgi:D-sedoheptulose 7-phosphate isomerase